jgi:hypothetical protein
MLIVEANETRLLRGFKPASWVYKGYGVFQYDLQYVETDEGFFRDKEWYQFTASLERAMKELVSKYKKHNDLWKAIRAYNGSGPSATDYANNVIQFAKYASEVGA